MEMDKMGVLTTFMHNIVVYNIPLLYGTVGEIVVEKSGSLNLGVEGIMAVGAIFGYIIGCYTNSMAVGILTAFVMGALMGLLFAVLTVSLQANQNITGLTLTTFGLGVYFFVGTGVKSVAWLAQLNTVAIFLVSALISMLHYGSDVAAATFSQVDSSFANMLQGAILFLVLAADFCIRFRVVPVQKGGKTNG